MGADEVAQASLPRATRVKTSNPRHVLAVLCAWIHLDQSRPSAGTNLFVWSQHRQHFRLRLCFALAPRSQPPFRRPPLPDASSLALFLCSLLPGQTHRSFEDLILSQVGRRQSSKSRRVQSMRVWESSNWVDALPLSTSAVRCALLRCLLLLCSSSSLTTRVSPCRQGGLRFMNARSRSAAQGSTLSPPGSSVA